MEEDLSNLDINETKNNLQDNIDYKKLNTYENYVEYVVNEIIL